MSVHDYHEKLPGYDPAQILHDGCGECEARAGEADHGLAHLDQRNFVRAWARATEWNRNGLANLSMAERPLLAMIWSVQLQFERVCRMPIGSLPVRTDRVQ